MKTNLAAVVSLLAGMLALPATPAWAQVSEVATVDLAGQVLNEIMAIPARGIPASLLSDAQGIAIIPNVVKGSFVVGVRHGRGVVVVRDEAGRWQPPTFISITGGSVGWQVGLQATDVILVFKTRGSVRGLLNGKFTLGADAAVAAGPVGRQAAAATDAALRAEIYSYSRSRGLFLGVSLDGAALQTEPQSNAVYYAGMGGAPPGVAPGQPVPLPPSAVKLLEQIAKYTVPAGATVPVATAAAAVTAPAVAAPPGDAARQAQRQLAEAVRRLDTVLDNNWRAYLALPPEVYGGDRLPNPNAVQQSLGRFDTVARDPRYQLLATRPEFRTAHELLRQYAATAQQSTPTLALPPPPR